MKGRFTVCNVFVRCIIVFFPLTLLSAVTCSAEEATSDFWDEAKLASLPEAERKAAVAWREKGFSLGAYVFLNGLGEKTPWEGDGSHVAHEDFFCPEVLNDGKRDLFLKSANSVQVLGSCRIDLRDADGSYAGFVSYAFTPSAMKAEAALGNLFGVLSSMDPISLSKSFVLERTGPGDLILWQKSKKRMAADGTFLQEGCRSVYFIRANVLVRIELRDGTSHDIFALATVLDEALLEALKRP